MRNAFDQLLCFCDSNAENKSKTQDPEQSWETLGMESPPWGHSEEEEGALVSVFSFDT